MQYRMRAAQLSALAMGCALSACAGGDTGVTSTNPPPSYTRVQDLEGDHTFQTGGVSYTTSAAGLSPATVQAFGSGVTVAYKASSDSYTLTAPDGATVTFGPADVQPPQPGSNDPYYAILDGSTRDQFQIVTPTVGGVPLSYTVIGSWGHVDLANGTGTIRLAVGGVPTFASDMPKSGTASYAAEVVSGALVRGSLASGVFSLGNGNSSATFSADFAQGTVQTALSLAGTPASGGPVESFGTFDGSGSIASGGPGFSGQLTGPSSATGVFSGAFFGPKAGEMAFNWNVTGSGFSAAGSVAGVKK